MEIMKVFSDLYDEERLYSVLLSEDEMDLYQYMFSDDADLSDAMAGVGATALGLGAVGGAGYGVKKGLEKYGNKSREKVTSANKAAYKKYVSETGRVKKAERGISKALKNADLVANPTNLVEEAAVKNYEAAIAERAKAEGLSKREFLRKVKNGKISLAKEGKLGKLARKGARTLGKAEKAILNNKKTAAAIAAGTLAAGAAGTYGYRKLND